MLTPAEIEALRANKRAINAYGRSVFGRPKSVGSGGPPFTFAPFEALGPEACATLHLCRLDEQRARYHSWLSALSPRENDQE